MNLKDIFLHTTLVSHVSLVSNFIKTDFVSIPKVSETSSYPISDAQRRLWVLSQFEGGLIAYNMPSRVYLKSLDVESFKRSVYSVIARHESLRTVFREDSEGEVRQVIISTDSLDFTLKEEDFRVSDDVMEAVDIYVREDSYVAFDLECGPLFRASLLRVSDSDYVFYYNMHHIISDGWSMEVLSGDVFSYYEAYRVNSEPLVEPLRIQYKDYAVWQLSQLEDGSYSSHRDYWLDRCLLYTSPSPRDS